MPHPQYIPSAAPGTVSPRVLPCCESFAVAGMLGDALSMAVSLAEAARDGGFDRGLSPVKRWLITYACTHVMLGYK